MYKKSRIQSLPTPKIDWCLSLIIKNYYHQKQMLLVGTLLKFFLKKSQLRHTIFFITIFFLMSFWRIITFTQFFHNFLLYSYFITFCYPQITIDHFKSCEIHYLPLIIILNCPDTKTKEGAYFHVRRIHTSPDKKIASLQIGSMFGAR